MIKRIQNKVAGSRLTLAVTSLYGVGIWGVSGLVSQGWWIQFICFALATYLMVELNNSNALIRIYSRTVSSAFIILSGVLCFLFPIMEVGISELCLVASLLTLFHTYQDKATMGWTFYTFLLLGLVSLLWVHVFWLVPFYWIAMLYFISSLSWRNFFASLIGLVLPYWFLAAGVFIRYKGDFALFTDHFAPLATFPIPIDYSGLTIPQKLSYGFVLLLSITGIIHFFRTSYNDRLRVRQTYECLILFNVASLAFIAILPQHYNLFIEMAIITASPLIAHFITLTNTRITNIAFFVIIGTALILTGLHLWMSSFIF